MTTDIRTAARVFVRSDHVRSTLAGASFTGIDSPTEAASKGPHRLLRDRVDHEDRLVRAGVGEPLQMIGEPGRLDRGDVVGSFAASSVDGDEHTRTALDVGRVAARERARLVDLGVERRETLDGVAVARVPRVPGGDVW